MNLHPGDELCDQVGSSPPTAEGHEISRGSSPPLQDAGLPPLPEPDHGLDIATMFDDDVNYNFSSQVDDEEADIESLPELRTGATVHNVSRNNLQSISESVASGLTYPSTGNCGALQSYYENRGSATSDDGYSESGKKRALVYIGGPKNKKPKNAGKIGSKYRCGKCGELRKVKRYSATGECLGEMPHVCEFISVHGEQNEARVTSAHYDGLQLGLKLAGVHSTFDAISRSQRAFLICLFIAGVEVGKSMLQQASREDDETEE